MPRRGAGTSRSSRGKALIANGRRLIYIVGTYPLLTTTFIDREIRQLGRWGVDIHVLSIRQPPPGIPLSDSQLSLQKGVEYLLPVDVPRLIAAHLYFAFKRPRTFFGTLIYLMTRPHPGHGARVKTLLHFGEGTCAAYLIRGMRFHELHAHFIDRAATVALVIGRLLNKSYSLSIHAAEDIFVHPVLLHEKIGAARHAVTCTRYNRAHIEALLGRDLSDEITFIPHGLDITAYRPRANHYEQASRILAVGQLVERKGFVDLIRACQILRERGCSFHCEIIGEGPQRGRLQELIDRLSLGEGLTLRGAMPHEEVVQRYAQAGMLVMPCVQSQDGNLDGIPNVLLEAMAMQVPVISTRISAIPELIMDGENGLLVDPGDPVKLAEAMERLIRSPQQSLRLAREGRRSVLANFDVQANIRRFAATLWPEWFS